MLRSLRLRRRRSWTRCCSESFNSRLRDELLDLEVFAALAEAKVLGNAIPHPNPTPKPSRQPPPDSHKDWLNLREQVKHQHMVWRDASYETARNTLGVRDEGSNRQEIQVMRDEQNGCRQRNVHEVGQERSLRVRGCL